MNINHNFDTDYIMDITLTHLFEVVPFLLLFEASYIMLLKKLFDFNTSYFLLHFIVNCVNTIILIPYIYQLFSDPLSKKNYSTYQFNEYMDMIYPIVIGLHTFHLLNNIRRINFDEITHHVITHIFWYGVNYCNWNPLYIAPMIVMSGIPGGITYLMLFLHKFKLINKLTEKKISMYLNIWIRGPVCVIFSTLMYVTNLNELGNDKTLYEYYVTLFMIFFTFVNGIHFMHTITESYYENYYENYYKKYVKTE